MIRLRSSMHTLLAVAAAATFVAPLSAQGPLPPAAEIIARYQKAIGGKEAFAAKQVMHITGTYAVMGISGTFEGMSARPNKSAARVILPGIGEIRTGHDGTVAWSLNPMEGPRLMEGPEKVQTVDRADFEASLRDATRFKTMETVERTQIAGRDCLKVRLVWNSGRETFDCYSPETGLLVASLGKESTNMGEMETVMLFDDYREFDGLKMPTKVSTQVMGVEQVVSISDVRFANVPASAFELPPEIKALIK